MGYKSVCLMFVLTVSMMSTISCTDANPSFKSVARRIEGNSGVTTLSPEVPQSPLPLPANPEETPLAKPLFTIAKSSSQNGTTSLLPIEFSVTFNTEINPSTFTANLVTYTGSMKDPVWVISNPSGDLKSFILTITSMKQEGTVLPTINGSSIITSSGSFFENIAAPTTEAVTFDSGPAKDSSQSFVTAGTLNSSTLSYTDSKGSQRNFSSYRRILDRTDGTQGSILNVKPFTDLDFQVNDEILIYIAGAGSGAGNGDCRGNVGNYTYASVSRIDPTNGFIELSSEYSLAQPNNYIASDSNSPDFCFIEVVRVPHFKDLTIDAGVMLKAPDFDYSLTSTTGGGGGILAFKVEGTLTMNGQISADESGYSGGIFNEDTANPRIRQGDGYGGLGGYSPSTYNTNGGGAKYVANITTWGGGGGGNAGVGGNGSINLGGGLKNLLCNANTTLCSPLLASLGGDQRIFMGGGGGGGIYLPTITSTAYSSTAGGKGGGIIIIDANTIKTTTTTGKITANGGSVKNNAGAGAGGSISINAQKLDVKTQLWGVDGGVNNATFLNHELHGGGGGYLSINYCAAKGILPQAMGAASAQLPTMPNNILLTTYTSASIEIARGGKVSIKGDSCQSTTINEVTATIDGSPTPYIGCLPPNNFYTTDIKMKLNNNIPLNAKILLAQLTISGLKRNGWNEGLSSYLKLKVGPEGTANWDLLTQLTQWVSSFSEIISDNIFKINVGSPNLSPDFKDSFNTLRPTGTELLAKDSKFLIHLEGNSNSCTTNDKFYFETSGANKPSVRIIYTTDPD